MTRDKYRKDVPIFKISLVLLILIAICALALYFIDY